MTAPPAGRAARALRDGKLHIHGGSRGVDENNF